MSELVPRESMLPDNKSAPPEQKIWIDQYLDERQSEIARYGHILYKRRKLVLGITLAVFAVGVVWTMTRPRFYSASVNIQIESENSVLPYKGMAALITPDPTYLRTQVEVLKSEALARRIVTRLQLANDEPRLTEVARWFPTNLTVSPIEGTQVLRVAYSSEDPQFAATAVNALADVYGDYGVEMKQESTTKARDFLQAELSKLKRKLEESEQRLVSYGRAHGILLPTEDNNVIMQRLTDLNRELTRVEAEVLSNEYVGLTNATLDNFPDRLKTGVMNSLDSRRSELEQKLASATQQFGAKWPEVTRLTREVAEVRQQIANEKKKAIQQSKIAYDLAVAHRDRLTQALSEQTARADKLTQDSIEYNILKREVETDRQLHEGLLQRLKETDVSSGLKAGNIHIINRGHVPRLPSSPNVPISLALSLTLGILIAAGVAVAAEMLDSTLKTPEDVERELQMPSLGAIPAFDKEWRQATGGQLVPLTATAPADLKSASGTAYWESYRSLRTALLFSAPESRPSSILVTSAIPREGKSTTAVNLAIALAQTGASTLIVDLDMRRPTVAHTFKLALDRGMSLYLSGQTKLNTEIQSTGIPNLFAIPAGPLPPNPPELVGSARMKRALELLERHFDYVIIDGPPLVPLTDAAIIASQVNGVVLVVGARTNVEAVQKARSVLKTVDANILGALLNNVKMGAPDAYYATAYSS